MTVKVLTVSEIYWPNGGGGELATHLILSLLREGFEVKVATGTREPERLPGVNYVHEPMLSKGEKMFLWFDEMKMIRNPVFCRLVEWSDIVYVPRFSLPIIPLAKKLDKRVVVHLHGYIPVSYTATVLAPFEEHRNRITRDDLMLERMKGMKYYAGALCTWWLPRLARKWIAEADAIVCVSRRQAQIVSELAPELKGKIKVVYNPMPPSLLQEETRKNLDNPSTFLYVGGDNYVKGIHVLLEALRMMGERGQTNFNLILTNKYSQKSLKALSQLKKMFSLNIEVFGRVNYEELLKLYSKAWCLLFPSIWEEPLPYAILESVLNRTIPLASNVGGIVEILGENARQFLVTPGDAGGLANKMEALAFKDANEICELGTSVSEHACRKFNSEDTVKKFAAILMGT